MSSVYKAWWLFGPIIGLLLLANTRDTLFEKNLFDTYSEGEYPTITDCPAASLNARTIDGSCNDLQQPAMGKVGMRFGRNVPRHTTHPDTAALMDPNPRTISRQILHRDKIIEARHLNYLAAAWIQFMVHDWVSHGPNETENPHQVPVAADDPISNTSFMTVERTRVDPTKDPADGQPPTYQNMVTAWWDGSQIYGSDLVTSQKLRSFEDGQLIVDSTGRLPVADGIDITGFNENWWVGLSLFHHLFVLEHNAIAMMLKSSYPSWDDQKLYDTARLINAALMAKIHTVDWTPAVLNNNTLRIAMIANWKGLLESRIPHTNNPILSGIVGGNVDHHNVPYSLTEEFTAVYRMHALLRDEVEIRRHTDHQLVDIVTLEDSAFAKTAEVVNNHGLTDLFYSFGHTHPGALTVNNYPKFLTSFPVSRSKEDSALLDLAAVDILRDRERGIPRYNEFRRLVQLKPIADFSELTDDIETAEQLRTIYKNDVELIDLFVGSMAEGHRAPGFGFGETAFQIFIAMASRRLMSDRFFTDDYNAETYTQAGMDYIRNTSINSVLLRHFPELEETLAQVGNAFFPWDEKSKWATVE